jgi:hypothetical protein
MSEVKVPKLNRKAREEDTREKTTQRKPWTPPSRLDAPPAPAGYKHRWIRAEAAGIEDRINISGKIREGYELVRSDEYPDFPIPTVEDGRYAGIISVGGMLLARIPEETVEERNNYYQRRALDQTQAADNDLLKSNSHSTMKIQDPNRQSKVTFGGSKS